MRPDNVERTGTGDDTEHCSKRRFREMQPVPYHQREEGVEDEERGESEVGKVRRSGLKLFPRHCYTRRGITVRVVVVSDVLRTGFEFEFETEEQRA